MNFTLMTALGFFIIFAMSTLGSAVVYFFKEKEGDKLHTLFLGFASGIMISASIWSLLLPAMEEAELVFNGPAWLPVAIGFVIGGLFLVLLDKIIPHTHSGTNQDEGPHVAVKKSTKLFFAVMIHNIPEGLAVGFAFGAAATIGTTAAYVSALGLAIGLGIQNFPEGVAVTLPLKGVTNSKHKAFLLGTASGAVEPIAAVIGYFMASFMITLQPWLLAFAAGAMIFVVAEDLIPDAQSTGHSHLATWGVMAGFVIMMILDVALA
ncbi:MAG: ZIP family metal transporter [Clostridia bacterium]|nr:ZIP family metal transporter [Clostridia bacterium]